MKCTREQRARLREAAGRPVDPARSLFGPDSVTWCLNRERALLLGGGRALLLQVAHPLVAAGVAAHSRFREAPLERLWRTLDLVLTIVFADAARALGAVEGIDRVHARVRGTLGAGVGPFPAGTAYDAGDPELLLWVHATLVDSALETYARFVAPLGRATRAAYWEESKTVARLMGVPDTHLPLTLADFERYRDGMVLGPTLAVGPASRDIAHAVFHPALSWVVAPAFAGLQFVTAGLLPASVRERYELSWSAEREHALGALGAVVRLGIPLLPSWVRLVPQALQAERVGPPPDARVGRKGRKLAATRDTRADTRPPSGGRRRHGRPDGHSGCS